MRIAWTGPSPEGEGAVSYAGRQLLTALADEGVELDCFFAMGESAIPALLRNRRNVRIFCEPPRWNHDRWYSKSVFSSFLTGQVARARAQRRLIRRLKILHAADPYDVIYQFSQLELFSLRRLERASAPLVIHPEVHAAGELRWHRRESNLAEGCESRFRSLVVRAMLRTRSQIQGRDARQVDLIVAPSRRFAEHLAEDYGVSRDRFCVVPNPIDLERFAPDNNAPRPDTVTLLFVSRLSVRKGVEMVVSLSHRLADLAGELQIKVVGDRTSWSDYRPLLAQLNPAVAAYVGPVDPEDLPSLYRHADALIQPSHYEPFALTVGEGLASGLPVLTSDEVGAAEEVDRRCCAVFPAGDTEACEQAVRAMLRRLQNGERAAMRRLARAEAERLFAPSHVARGLARHLELALAHGQT